MINDAQKEIQYNDEIDFEELLRVLWSAKIKIIAITALFAFISVVYALWVPNQYKAEILLAPAQYDGSDLSGISRQIGGLASLAGVNLGDSQTSEVQIAQEVMRSWSFIEDFIRTNKIEVEVYAAKGWDRKTNKLLIDDDLYNIKTQEWYVEDDNTGEIGPPSTWKLYKEFSELLVIAEDESLGLVSLSIEHYSPYIAKQWSDLYISAINAHMQKRQLERVNNNINYLNLQIEKTSKAEMKEIFYKIVEEQTKDKMVAEASPEYAFVVVSPSMIPEEKSQPQRALIVILCTFLGGILSILIVLVKHYTGKLN